MGIREPFAPDNVVDKSVECFSGSFDTLRIEGIALRAEPLMSVPVMHRGVWSNKARVRKAGAPRRCQRHELRA